MKTARKLSRWKSVRVWLAVLLLGIFVVVFKLETDRINEMQQDVKGHPVRAVDDSSSLMKYDMQDGKQCDDNCQDKIQEIRQSHVSRGCKRKLSETTFQEVDAKFVKSLHHVYVLDEHKLLFCYVPKVACTNWKRILLTLMGVLSPDNDLPHLYIHYLAYDSIPVLYNYSVEDAVQRLNTYRKVLFVREPFSRLVSAYRDKLELPKNNDSISFRRKYGPKIKGLNLRKLGLTHRPDFNITFYEYISYLANPANRLNWLGEEHWRSIDELCRPCDLHYDFIGRIETLHRDTDYVIRRLLGKDPETLRVNDPTNFTNSSNALILRDYLLEIPERKLNALIKRFQIDFEAFDYKKPKL